MRILGIESSCDETAVAVFEEGKGISAHQIFSKVALHSSYGGVVPELAARDHIRNLTKLIDKTLKEAKLNKEQLDAIAYTQGPGLIGSLLVGASVARSLAYALNIPSLGVHHLEAHLMAVMLADPKPTYPFLALLISGGHTLLLEVQGLGEYQLLGETLDDAVGEAFDKTARLLGLSYPGGPELAHLALSGRKGRFQLPRPMMNKPGLNFSFSGLKTHVMNLLRQQTKLDQQTKADLAYAFQEAVVDTLISKCERAIQQTGIQQLVMAGGVSANQELRFELKRRLTSVDVYYPSTELCTDNGAMIAYLGYLRFKRGEKDLDKVIRASASTPSNKFLCIEPLI